jgi:hypothetical protein
MPTVRPGETDSIPTSPYPKRSRGEDAVPVRSHSRATIPADYRTINGWGADLDPANRPSYPKELPSDVMNVRGEVTDRQVPHAKVHVSNEHPDLTPVFGIACPPKGLSGALRDYAYEYGEASNRHWLTLMLADRIDVVESLVMDALRGKPDRYIKEKGWTAYAKYGNRKQKAVVVGAALLGALAVGLMIASVTRDDEA